MTGISFNPHNNYCASFTYEKNGDTKIRNFPAISKLEAELGLKLGQSQAAGLIFLIAAPDCL